MRAAFASAPLDETRNGHDSQARAPDLCGSVERQACRYLYFARGLCSGDTQHRGDVACSVLHRVRGYGAVQRQQQQQQQQQHLVIWFVE